MEVNADDMVIMSDSEEEMMADITETLKKLLAINLKLNPKKCSFGVKGVYSGHLIMKQGIKADPSMVKAVSNLQPPRTVSEMQNLNKKIAALSMFLSKSAERTLPFMKTPRSCTSRKMVQWTKEADEAFRRMKECLESLPTMVIPTKGETLIMYLTTSEEIVSAVLMAKRGKETNPRILPSEGQELDQRENISRFPPLPENREANNEEVKRKESELENAWKLFIDGASSSDGSGAEYEALLAGLRIAKEMEI
ncbi:reverse transcriptase domain-containing protein [Tanacetum coccineum]